MRHATAEMPHASGRIAVWLAAACLAVGLCLPSESRAQSTNDGEPSTSEQTERRGETPSSSNADDASDGDEGDTTEEPPEREASSSSDDGGWAAKYRDATVLVVGMKTPTCAPPPDDGSDADASSSTGASSDNDSSSDDATSKSGDDRADTNRTSRCELGLIHGSGLAFTPSRQNSERIWVVTNRHVVDRAQAVAVQFSGGIRKFPAEIKYVDDRYDVALLGLVVPEDVDAGTLTPIDGSVLSKRLLNPTSCQPPKVMNVPPLEASDSLRVVGFPYTPTSPRARVVQRTYVRCHSDASGRAYLQTDAAFERGTTGGPVFDAKGRLLGLAVDRSVDTDETNDADDGAGFVLPSGAVVRATSEYDRNEWKWRPSTNSVRAYSALARAAAHYLEFRHHREAGDAREAKRALRSALQQTTKARKADSTYAASYLFWAGLLWTRIERSPEQAAREYANAALGAVEKAERYGESLDAGTQRFIEMIEQLYYRYHPDEAEASSETAGAPDSEEETAGSKETETGEDEAEESEKDGEDDEDPPVTPQYVDVRFRTELSNFRRGLRGYGGRIRGFVWRRYVTIQAGYYRYAHLLERHTDNILKDYAKIGVGTAPVFDRDVRLSISAGFLGLGASAFVGGYLESRVQYGSLDGVAVVLDADAKLLKTSATYVNPNLDGIYPGFEGRLVSAATYARPSTTNGHLDATLAMHYGDAEFNGYLSYDSWSPTRQLVGGGGLLYQRRPVRMGPVFKVASIRYDDRVTPNRRRRLGGGGSFAVQTRRFEIFVDYLYWWGPEGRNEHATGVGFSIDI